jgi:hypothetical protein
VTSTTRSVGTCIVAGVVGLREARQHRLNADPAERLVKSKSQALAPAAARRS